MSSSSEMTNGWPKTKILQNPNRILLPSSSSHLLALKKKVAVDEEKLRVSDQTKHTTWDKLNDRSNLNKRSSKLGKINDVTTKVRVEDENISFTTESDQDNFSDIGVKKTKKNVVEIRKSFDDVNEYNLEKHFHLSIISDVSEDVRVATLQRKLSHVVTNLTPSSLSHRQLELSVALSFQINKSLSTPDNRSYVMRSAMMIQESTIDLMFQTCKTSSSFHFSFMRCVQDVILKNLSHSMTIVLTTVWNGKHSGNSHPATSNFEDFITWFISERLHKMLFAGSGSITSYDIKSPPAQVTVGRRPSWYLATGHVFKCLHQFCYKIQNDVQFVGVSQKIVSELIALLDVSSSFVSSNRFDVIKCILRPISDIACLDRFHFDSTLFSETVDILIGWFVDLTHDHSSLSHQKFILDVIRDWNVHWMRNTSVTMNLLDQLTDDITSSSLFIPGVFKDLSNVLKIQTLLTLFLSILHVVEKEESVLIKMVLSGRLQKWCTLIFARLASSNVESHVLTHQSLNVLNSTCLGVFIIYLKYCSVGDHQSMFKDFVQFCANQTVSILTRCHFSDQKVLMDQWTVICSCLVSHHSSQHLTSIFIYTIFDSNFDVFSLFIDHPVNVVRESFQTLTRSILKDLVTALNSQFSQTIFSSFDLIYRQIVNRLLSERREEHSSSFHVLHMLKSICAMKWSSLSMWTLDPPLLLSLVQFIGKENDFIYENHKNLDSEVVKLALELLFDHCSNHTFFVKTSEMIVTNENFHVASSSFFSSTLTTIVDVVRVESASMEVFDRFLHWAEHLLCGSGEQQQKQSTLTTHQWSVLMKSESKSVWIQFIQTLLNISNFVDSDFEKCYRYFTTSVEVVSSVEFVLRNENLVKRCLEVIKVLIVKYSFVESIINGKDMMLLDCLSTLLAFHVDNSSLAVSKLCLDLLSRASSFSLMTRVASKVSKFRDGCVVHELISHFKYPLTLDFVVSTSLKCDLGTLFAVIKTNNEDSMIRAENELDKSLESIFSSSSSDTASLFTRFATSVVQFNSTRCKSLFMATVVALHCISSKLKSPLGSAQNTLTSIEFQLKQRQKPANRLILNVFHCLEKLMSVCYDGSCSINIVIVPDTNPVLSGSVKTFFKANKKTCVDWLNRTRCHVIQQLYSIKDYHSIVFNCERYFDSVRRSSSFGSFDTSEIVDVVIHYCVALLKLNTFPVNGSSSVRKFHLWMIQDMRLLMKQLSINNTTMDYFIDVCCDIASGRFESGLHALRNIGKGFEQITSNNLLFQMSQLLMYDYRHFNFVRDNSEYQKLIDEYICSKAFEEKLSHQSSDVNRLDEFVDLDFNSIIDKTGIVDLQVVDHNTNPGILYCLNESGMTKFNHELFQLSMTDENFKTAFNCLANRFDMKLDYNVVPECEIQLMDRLTSSIAGEEYGFGEICQTTLDVINFAFRNESTATPSVLKGTSTLLSHVFNVDWIPQNESSYGKTSLAEALTSLATNVSSNFPMPLLFEVLKDKPDNKDENFESVEDVLRYAVKLNSDSPGVWESYSKILWSRLSESVDESSDSNIDLRMIPAIDAMFQFSIHEVPETTKSVKIISAILKLFNLLVNESDKYGKYILEQLSSLLMSSTEMCSKIAHQWRWIVPQLLSRFNHPNPNVRQFITLILSSIGHESQLRHLVIFPLISDETYTKNRDETLRSIMKSCLDQDHNVTVQFVNEMKRLSVLWPEMWISTVQQYSSEIQKRSRRLRDEVEKLRNNVSLSESERSELAVDKLKIIFKPIKVVFDRLLQLTVLSDPKSDLENDFQRTFGATLFKLMNAVDAKRPDGLPIHNYNDVCCGDILCEPWIRLCKLSTVISNYWTDRQMSVYSTGYSSSLHGNKAVMNLTHLSSFLSSNLSDVNSFGSPAISISVTNDSFTSKTVRSLDPLIQILPTKTKPKRIGFNFTDGTKMSFLLKGTEDLKQDEKIMQLMKISNLFYDSKDRSTHHSTYYSVIPLGMRCGLIQWISGCVPLYSMYKRWISSLKKDEQFCPRPAEIFAEKMLPKLQNSPRKDPELSAQSPNNRESWDAKLIEQCISELIEETPSNILSNELWYASISSANYSLIKRNYITSLGVMCIFGYVIGLGDRHLDNLLLNFKRNSIGQFTIPQGQLIHIDFNICFDRGLRLRVPERVPFRLTQNVVGGLGYMGVESHSFTSVCCETARCLVANRDIIQHLIEALIYDPVYDWKLWSGGDENRHHPGHVSANDSTTLRRNQMHIELSLHMLSVRIFEISGRWIRNKSMVMGCLNDLNDSYLSWNNETTNVEKCEEGVQLCKDALNLLVTYKSKPNDAGVRCINDLFKKFTLNQSKGSILSDVEHFLSSTVVSPTSGIPHSVSKSNFQSWVDKAENEVHLAKIDFESNSLSSKKRIDRCESSIHYIRHNRLRAALTDHQTIFSESVSGLLQTIVKQGQGHHPDIHEYVKLYKQFSDQISILMNASIDSVSLESSSLRFETLKKEAESSQQQSPSNDLDELMDDDFESSLQVLLNQFAPKVYDQLLDIRDNHKHQSQQDETNQGDDPTPSALQLSNSTLNYSSQSESHASVIVDESPTVNIIVECRNDVGLRNVSAVLEKLDKFKGSGEGQRRVVMDLIGDATKFENLALMYEGWTSWV